MSTEERERNAGLQRFQAIMHLGMGAFYVVIGVLVIYIRYFGAMELPAGLAYALGAMMILYGFFRIWRGISWLRHRKRLR